MRICKVLAVLAAVGLGVPALAVQVQWSDFEIGTNYGQGLVGENLVAPAGYGPPTSYDLVTDPKTTGTLAQEYYVPGDAFNTDPRVGGWMMPDDGGGAFDPTDWRDFIINTLGGPAPLPNSPCTFIADVRIDVDFPDDYNTIQFGPLHNAPDSSFDVFEPKVNPDHDFGVWEMDFVFLTTEFDGAGDLVFILLLEDFCEINNPFAGNAQFYMDNLRIEYTPEPAALVLFGLGGLALLRRRR